MGAFPIDKKQGVDLTMQRNSNRKDGLAHLLVKLLAF